MPWPAQITRSAGEFRGPAGTITLTGPGAADPRLAHAAARIQCPTLNIIVEHAHPGIQHFGDNEAYQLSVTSYGATLTATEPLGALRGVQTFLQLMHRDGDMWAIPTVEITDQPRFGWRGLSLDVSRHFLSVATIQRTLNGMAAVKLNVLHWHLSDDQGFRVESRLYPLLQGKGSDGLFYTQDEIRGVVAYARDRGIRVVPEFDIPGHATSWFVGYPYLASGKGPYQIVREAGVLPATMDPSKESTYRFLDRFIGEMAGLFPDAYFHIGGDEVNPKGEWSNNPHIRAFMKRNRLKDLDALQSQFNRRVQKIVAAHGKQMEGWDEILNPNLPKNILIESWRGQKSLADAAHKGYSGILSSGYYLDLMQPASQHYAVDPIKAETAALTPEEQKRILGGEAAMWEELATEENIDAKLWPRLAAIAERFWSAANVTDEDSMYRRLATTSQWLETLGLEHRSGPRHMLKLLAGDSDPAPLEEFASVLEPVKGYARHRNHKYSMLEPFNRLVDSLAPESDAAREFNLAVDRPADKEYVRASLNRWHRIAMEVLPLLRGSTLLSENAPLAETMEELCRLGLTALDSQTPLTIPEIDKKSEILIAFEPGVRKLLGIGTKKAASR